MRRWHGSTQPGCSGAPSRSSRSIPPAWCASASKTAVTRSTRSRRRARGTTCRGRRRCSRWRSGRTPSSSVRSRSGGRSRARRSAAPSRRCASSAWRLLDVNLRQAYYDAGVVTTSLELANAVKLNEEELPVVAQLCGVAVRGAAPLDLLRALCERFGLKLAALTRGRVRCAARHTGCRVRVSRTAYGGRGYRRRRRCIHGCAAHRCAGRPIARGSEPARQRRGFLRLLATGRDAPDSRGFAMDYRSRYVVLTSSYASTRAMRRASLSSITWRATKPAR